MPNNSMPRYSLRRRADQRLTFLGNGFRGLPASENYNGVKLSQSLLLKLGKKYAPSAMVGLKFKGKDVTFKTDSEGNPVVLLSAGWMPTGESRRALYAELKRDGRGAIIKDHWDLKGKSS